MKVKLVFGSAHTKYVSWYGGIKNIPSIISYYGRNWEFDMYQVDSTNHVDYECFFSEIGFYDLRYLQSYDTFESIFGTQWDHRSEKHGGCECGAWATSFPWDHMKFCKAREK